MQVAMDRVAAQRQPSPAVAPLQDGPDRLPGIVFVRLELAVLVERQFSFVFIFKSHGAIVEHIALVKLNSFKPKRFEVRA
jgi:hypothetical protein